MFIWGYSDRETALGTGEFDCPCCKGRCSYSYVLLANWFHFYFIPVSQGETIAEFVRCENCQEAFSVDVLQLTDDRGVAQAPTRSSSDQFGSIGHNRTVVTLSDSAAAEIRVRMARGGFESHIAVRVVLHAAGSWCDIQFDDPYSDGRDWIGRSQNFSVLVDKADAARVEGSVIDFQCGEFRVTSSSAK